MIPVVFVADSMTLAYYPPAGKPKKEADASITRKSRGTPFLVLENTLGQTDKSLKKKGKRWIRHSQGRVKCAILTRIHEIPHSNPKDFKVLVTVIKGIRRASRSGIAGHYYYEPSILYYDEEIYPTPSFRQFTLALNEVVTEPAERALYSTTLLNQIIPVSLSAFHRPARAAVAAARDGKIISPANSNYSAPSDESSESAGFNDADEGGEVVRDDEDDPDYV